MFVAADLPPPAAATSGAAGGRRRRFGDGVRSELPQFAAYRRVGRTGVPVHLELIDEIGELRGLLRQGLASRGRLFHDLGVLSGRLVHLIDRAIDLLQARRLFLGACGGLGDRPIDLGHLRNDALQRSAAFGHEVDASVDLRRRGRD